MLSKEDILYRKKLWDSVLADVRQFFVSRDFLEFQTPLLVKSPGMEPNLSPLKTVVNNQKAGFITSPEYSMKKLLGTGFEKIFTITPVFRDNEAGRHNTPEFLMLEWYAPGVYEDLMAETEELLQFVLGERTVWPKIKHTNANIDEHGDPHVEHKRFFVKNYPVAEASLAQISVDGSYAERFEAFGDGMELCNGFAELTDATEQRRRFEAEKSARLKAEKEVFPIDEELLSAIESIKKPVYGNALGLDRLVMLKYGIGDINDVQIFPSNQRFV